MLTQERLKEVVDYNPETGIFTWRCAQGKRTDLIGQTAGFDVNGYIGIRIDYERYPAHRLAWLYVHGRWPVNEIDHRDRVRSNNRINNLREATHEQNLWNQGGRAWSTSKGIRGVSWDTQTSKWRATITIRKKTKSLGRFEKQDEARAVREAAERLYYGEFAGAT